MVIRALLKRNTYYDSITLMSVAQAVKDLPGVEDVGAVIATELNRELLRNSDLLPAAFLAEQETPRRPGGCCWGGDPCGTLSGGQVCPLIGGGTEAR